MAEFPNISRPGDGSLRHRIDEYMAALDAFGKLEQSVRTTERSGNSEWIGDATDLAEAEKLLKSSLAHAAAAIDAKELRHAVEQGLLSDDQAKSFAALKTEQEFQSASHSNRQNSSSRYKQSR